MTILLSISPFRTCGHVDYKEIVLGSGAQAYLQARDKSKIKSPVSTHDSPFPQEGSQKFITIIVSKINIIKTHNLGL